MEKISRAFMVKVVELHQISNCSLLLFKSFGVRMTVLVSEMLQL